MTGRSEYRRIFLMRPSMLSTVGQSQPPAEMLPYHSHHRVDSKVMRLDLIIFISTLFATTAIAQNDPALDWLLSQATTAPSTQPTTDATTTVSPFQEKNSKDIRVGIIHLSDGSTVKGKIATTAQKPIRIWDEKDKEYRDVPFALIRSIKAEVLWEREEKEWRFIDSGSDIKEFTGKTYPAREYHYTVTLIDGQTLSGGIVAPIYFKDDKEEKTYVLHKRQKGEVDQTLKDLVYVARVELD
jgi:hypothetical protein